MKITLRSTDAPLGYVGVNDRDQTQTFSGGADACRPMETVLMAMAACSSIDVETLLEKMRAPATGVEVSVEAERAEGVPAVFTKVHLRYRIRGDVPEHKAAKAVRMSMDQYCSVSMMLRASVEITYEVEVAPAGSKGEA